MDEKTQVEFSKLSNYLTTEQQKVGELTELISSKIVQFRSVSLSHLPACSEKQVERVGVLGDLNKEIDSLKRSRITLEAIFQELSILL